MSQFDTGDNPTKSLKQKGQCCFQVATCLDMRVNVLFWNSAALTLNILRSGEYYAVPAIECPATTVNLDYERCRSSPPFSSGSPGGCTCNQQEGYINDRSIFFSKSAEISVVGLQVRFLGYIKTSKHLNTVRMGAGIWKDVPSKRHWVRTSCVSVILPLGARFI